ncbi:MAG: ATP-binding cassette, subfamily bacterial, partial [Actinomycetota bacterium]
MTDSKRVGVLDDRPDLRRTLRGIGLMISTSFRAAPWLAAGVFGCTALGAAMVPLASLFIKQTADAAVAGNTSLVVKALIALAVFEGASGMLSMYGIAILRMNMEERTRLYIERHILRLVGGLPGLEHHERPEYANEV